MKKSLLAKTPRAMIPKPKRASTPTLSQEPNTIVCNQKTFTKITKIFDKLTTKPQPMNQDLYPIVMPTKLPKKKLEPQKQSLLFKGLSKSPIISQPLLQKSKQ